MPKKVLIAIDWSEFAEKAFDWYMYHFHRKGVKVILCHHIKAGYVYHVHKKGTTLVLCHFLHGEKEKELRKKEEELTELQEVYETRLLQLKIDYEWITGCGTSPGEHIIATSNENRCEMIIMGARGLGKIKRALLGSVSDHVIRKAKVPVLICKWDG